MFGRRIGDRELIVLMALAVCCFPAFLIVIGVQFAMWFVSPFFCGVGKTLRGWSNSAKERTREKARVQEREQARKRQIPPKPQVVPPEPSKRELLTQLDQDIAAARLGIDRNSEDPDVKEAMHNELHALYMKKIHDILK